jgi:hypothetical protein
MFFLHPARPVYWFSSLLPSWETGSGGALPLLQKLDDFSLGNNINSVRSLNYLTTSLSLELSCANLFRSEPREFNPFAMKLCTRDTRDDLHKRRLGESANHCVCADANSISLVYDPDMGRPCLYPTTLLLPPPPLGSSDNIVKFMNRLRSGRDKT